MEEKVQSTQQKFTYEQLEKIATELSMQVQQLSNRLNESNMFNTFKRLDYLFKVLEVASNSLDELFTSKFVKDCAQEIQTIMAPVPETLDEPIKEEE